MIRKVICTIQKIMYIVHFSASQLPKNQRKIRYNNIITIKQFQDFRLYNIHYGSLSSYNPSKIFLSYNMLQGICRQASRNDRRNKCVGVENKIVCLVINESVLRCRQQFSFLMRVLMRDVCLSRSACLYLPEEISLLQYTISYSSSTLQLALSYT